MESLKLDYAKYPLAIVFTAMLGFFACQAKGEQENEIKNAGAKQGNNVDTSLNSPSGVVSSTPEYEKYFEQGNTYSKNNRFLDAIKSYRQALELNNEAPSAHYNLANVYVATNKLNNAIEEYKLAIKLNPLIPDYHRNLGYAYALQNNGDKAKLKYEELKKLAPAKAEELMQWIQKAQLGG